MNKKYIKFKNTKRICRIREKENDKCHNVTSHKKDLEKHRQTDKTLPI